MAAIKQPERELTRIYVFVRNIHKEFMCVAVSAADGTHGTATDGTATDGTTTTDATNGTTTSAGSPATVSDGTTTDASTNVVMLTDGHLTHGQVTQFHRTAAALLTATVLTETAQKQQWQPKSTPSQQVATTSTYTALQPAKSSSYSALSAAFTDYPSLDTPRPAPVTPGGTHRTETQDTSGDLSLSFTGLMDTDHPSV
ncbi:cell wall protein SED1-like [Amblyraja radiata]|uniref:cell wall protein SED1-like n=1 Tax=Amblyraja radiata TaxID=386614 RepID=UPI0014030AC6|nr:cell wall protein SED1-like [Amblyraja radiata]